MTIAGTDPAQPRWPQRLTLLLLCFAAAFVCYIDRVNISVAAIAMQEAFGWSQTTKGLVLSSFFIGYMIFQVPSGWLANRCGGRIVMGAAIAWWSLFTILTPLAAAVSLPVLLLARVGMGLGEAATFPAGYYLGARWFPQNERSRFVAVLLSGVPAGTVFALLTTGWIVTHWGWQSVFYVFGAAGLVVTAAWFALVHDSPAEHPRISAAERALLATADDKRERSGPTPWRRLLALPAVWALVFNHFCSNWILYMLLSWLPSYFRATQDLSLINAGLFSAAPWLAMFTTINLGAWLADGMIRRGVNVTTVRKLMQSAGLLGAGLCLLLARDAPTPVAALLVMCCALGALGFTWAGFAPNHLDIAPRHADVLMGLTNTAGTVPGVIGVAVTGWLVDQTGSFDAAFVLAAAVAAAGTLVWLLFATGRRLID
ncbi:MAG: ACS family MFS transporter [Gammaproteobacteria bacterium]|nr:ACS family MFS transporter [Gammaproteobacteria bacterium]